MVTTRDGTPILTTKLRYGAGLFTDWVDTLLRRRDWSTPPRRLLFIGGGDFAKTGEAYLNFFVDVCGIKPKDRVLDVGCGVGRMAIPLTRYLSLDGAYYGFDVVKPGIDWCTKKITSRFPQFRFEWANVYNKTYNPLSTEPAVKYRFPYSDGEFDFVFLTSVFTHMLPADLSHYIEEIARVLKPGKPCLITFFLLNVESRRLISSGQSQLDFRHDAEGCWTATPEAPESAVAYDEGWVLDLHMKTGLAIERPIRYGTWSGRKDALRFQDVVISRKRG